MVLAQTIFHANDVMWNLSLLKTGEFLIEIGLILVGAFYFIEVAHHTKVLDSLASLVKEVSSNRIVQGVLVTFPLELMVEGSSGFGTPLLIVAPLLLSLHFPIELCAVLPFINMVNGIPFGALGTPLRLGFPTPIAHATAILLIPFAFIGPLLTYFLIARFDQKTREHPTHHIKMIAWVLFLGGIYTLTTQWVSNFGPEFPALASGFVTFAVGVFSARLFFHRKDATPIKNKTGLVIYGCLLIALWIGKQIWMDALIPGTHIRVFNPGFVFILFAVALSFYFKEESALTHFFNSFQRARRTLFVFFCMTFTVQILRNSGALDTLTSNLPEYFLHHGVSLLGWFGSILIGTSTVANLLLSKVVDPVAYAPLAVGSAFGVQMAFQSISAVRSILNEKISEERILTLIAPVALGFVLLLLILQ